MSEATEETPTTWLEVVIPRRLYDAFRERLSLEAVQRGEDWVGEYGPSADDMGALVATLLEQWLRPNGEGTEERLDVRAYSELLNQIREGRPRAAWSERYELDLNGAAATLVSERGMGVSLIEFEKDGVVVRRVRCEGVA